MAENPFDLRTVFVASMADIKNGTNILGVADDLATAKEFVAEHAVHEIENNLDIRTHSYIITELEINAGRRPIDRWSLDSSKMSAILCEHMKRRYTSNEMNRFELVSKIRNTFVKRH